MRNVFYCRSTDPYVPLMIAGTDEIFFSYSKGKLLLLSVKTMRNFKGEALEGK